MASASSFALLALALAAPNAAQAQTLNSFGVLAGSAVTNTGPSVIEGNVGVSPGSAISGFPPGTVVPPYTIYQNNAVAAQAQNDLTTAYNVLAGRPFDVDLTGQDLGTVGTLTAGVYNFDSSAQLTGTLTLDGGGDPDAVFIFNIGSTLTTAAASDVVLIGGAQASNVFFRVGSSATLGATTEFQGRILALTSITLVTGANITCGAVLARNGAVTLDTNEIRIPGSAVCPIIAAVIGDDLDEDAPDSAEDLADAIDDYVDGGGILPIGFQVLDVLTPAELAEALSQISGEAATGVAPTGMQAMDSFLNMVMAPGLNRSPATPLQAPPRDTVRVLGYGPETAPAAGAPFASLDQPPIGAASDPRLWEIWAGVYGGYRDNDGDDDAGTHDRSSHHGGIAVGIDRRIAPDTKVGLAIGGGRTDFDLASNRGDGGSDMLSAALYARSDIDRAYVSGALAYAYHDVSVDRHVTFAGDDHFSSDFDAHNVAAHIEVGYRLGWFIPYAALRAQAFFTPSYDEETESGASTFALSYDENTTTSLRTELGTRIEKTFAVGADADLSLRGRVAWAHDTWSDTDIDAKFQSVPGIRFSVEGAEPAENLLLLSAGAELGFGNGLSFGLAVDTELAEESQTYTGTGRVRYRW
jgi:hypothetical protein